MDILFLSKRIFIHDEENLINGGIIVTTDGKIRKILKSIEQVNSFLYNNEVESMFDFEDKVLMPGLIDESVHITEPGRSDWESFKSATKAAAAGGYTTIMDMPIYSIPPVISAENFKIKAIAARGKIYIDMGIWGGIVPDNTSISYINALIRCGVIGFFCMLCPSQIPEFPNITEIDVKSVLDKIEAANTVLAFHPEIQIGPEIKPDESQPKLYETFLKTRPASMELNAVQMISDLSKNNKKVKMHIMHLSSADSLALIEKCKQDGNSLTVQTCPHYLTLASDEVPEARTEFKCWPPIREKENQAKLWQAIKNGNIDSISTNHVATLPGLKYLTFGKNRGNFIKAWEGVASLQLGLPIFWTEASKYDIGLKDVYRLFCENPAKLCGIDNFKGKIKEGYEADFCVWDPDEEFVVSAEMIYFQNKSNPYMGKKLKGTIHATIVRGLHVYQQYQGFGEPLGRVLVRRNVKQVVKFSD